MPRASIQIIVAALPAHCPRNTTVLLALGLALCGCPTAEPPTDRFIRAVVVPEYPLTLLNSQEDPVTWPLWGGAFAIGDLSIRASLTANGTSGLVIAGPGPIEERVAIELVFAGEEWSLRETAGGEFVQDVVGLPATDGELVVELEGSEVRVIGMLGELSMVLTEPLGPEGAEAGLYVTLVPGAELTINDIALTAALPRHPKLGTPLRQLAADRGLEIGTALDVWPPLHDLELESLLGQQFNRIAPTGFYWPTTRGEDQDFFFMPADLAVNYGLVHDQSIAGMFLVWDYALPNWVLDLQSSGDALALEFIFDDHIRTLVDRYEGRVDAWIVVNEAIWGSEQIGEPAQFAETLWYDALGPEYIERAFEVAHTADPSAVLLYNESGAEALNDKSDFMYIMAIDFLDRGVPIDGVGLQFHVHAASPPPMTEVQANMERFGELGLSVHITELDVSLEGMDLPEAEALELQASIYAGVLETCLAVAACSSWTVFGFSDRYAWDQLGDAAPLLFDAAYQAKPAFFAVQDALR